MCDTCHTNRVRAAAGHNPIVGAGAGELVAEWSSSWAPVVIDAHAETDWAETLVLDSTDVWRKILITMKGFEVRTAR